MNILKRYYCKSHLFLNIVLYNINACYEQFTLLISPIFSACLNNNVTCRWRVESMNRNEQKCFNCTRGDWGRELGPENTHQYFVKFLVHTCHAPSLINGVNIDKNTAIVRLPAPQTHTTLHAACSCVESSPYIVKCIAWRRALVRLYWDCGEGKTTVVIRIRSLHTVAQDSAGDCYGCLETNSS